MNRRKFTQMLAGGAGVSAIVPVGMAKVINKPSAPLFEKGQRWVTTDGIKLTLTERVNPTNNKDHKQFILRFDVENTSKSLTEKIYHVIDAAGVKRDIYMTPIARNQLQATFNWRTHG